MDNFDTRRAEKKRFIRFNDLEYQINGIASKVLSERLNELEETCIIERIIVQEMPLKVKYNLTERGNDFIEILTLMKKWGEKYSIVARGCSERNCNSCNFRNAAYFLTKFIPG